MDRKRSCADPAGAALARQFRTVAAYYRGAERELEKQGVWSYRMTASGAWALSRPAHVFYFLRKTGIPKESLFIDLGSGNGIVACIAGLFARSIGIESDPDLVASARTAAGRLGLDGRVSFIRADFFSQRIRRADYLYVYPDKPLYRLEEILPAGVEHCWSMVLIFH